MLRVVVVVEAGVGALVVVVVVVVVVVAVAVVVEASSLACGFARWHVGTVCIFVNPCMRHSYSRIYPPVY